MKTVKQCLKNSGREEGRDYSGEEFDRFFRRVYQVYGCPKGYILMPETFEFLEWARRSGYNILGLG